VEGDVRCGARVVRGMGVWGMGVWGYGSVGHRAVEQCTHLLLRNK
jgi:hypothetical protein